jgi:hypothetical protein
VKYDDSLYHEKTLPILRNSQTQKNYLRIKAKLEKRSRSETKIHPIPTALMGTHVREMQKRLQEKAIASKREFSLEVIKEVRVQGNEITLTYRLPWAPTTVSTRRRGGRFFTLSKMVVAAGLEPATSRM